MMNAITKTVQKELGYTKTDNKLISTSTKGRDNKDIQGFYSNETKTSYINEKNITNGNEALVKVSGVEMQRAIDYETNTLNNNSTKEYRDERSKFSQNVGENVKNYTNFALDFTNQGSMTTANTSRAPVIKNTQVQSVFNTSVANNNIEFARVDKNDGDNSPAHVFGAVVGGLANTYQQYSRNGGSFNNFSIIELGVNIGTGAWSAGASTIGVAIFRGGIAAGSNESYNHVINVESNSIKDKIIEVGKTTVIGLGTGFVVGGSAEIGNKIIIKTGVIGRPVKESLKTYRQSFDTTTTGVSGIIIPKLNLENKSNNDE